MGLFALRVSTPTLFVLCPCVRTSEDSPPVFSRYWGPDPGCCLAPAGIRLFPGYNHYHVNKVWQMVSDGVCLFCVLSLVSVSVRSKKWRLNAVFLSSTFPRWGKILCYSHIFLLFVPCLSAYHPLLISTPTSLTVRSNKPRSE